MSAPSPNSHPQVTILLPTLNEESLIEGCLRSIACCSYPLESLDICVIDGGSTDNTRKIVNELSSHFPQIRMLDNPRKIVPAALNLGIEHSDSPILIWLGAHASYDTDYIKLSVETLMRTNAASVGGVITPVGNSYIGKAIAMATTSKFGIGNAKYRYAKTEQSVDTVFGGCWFRESLIEVGGFNEAWVRNQDGEFNYRLRKNVGEIILNPNIKCTYFVRESLRGLAKQYFQYGQWRFRTLVKHPGSLTMRQSIPIALISSLLISVLSLPFSFQFGILLPAVYCAACLLASIYVSAKNSQPRLFPALAIIYPTIHLSWGVGVIFSALRALNPTRIKHK